MTPTHGHSSTTPCGQLRGWSDGACAGNPGFMGIGGVLKTDADDTIASFSDAAGYGTNNEAEYLALIRVLELAAAKNAPGILCQSDSELIINQVNGEYEVRHPRMFRLYQRVRHLCSHFPDGARFVWIPRESNASADALASRAVGMPQAPLTATGNAEPWGTDPGYEPDPAELVTLPAVPAVVSALLAKTPPRFRDFMQLRTGGASSYSRMKLERLQEAIRVRHGARAVAWLLDALDGDTQSAYAKSALRWCARGLPPDYALKKASVDLEMAGRYGRGR